MQIKELNEFIKNALKEDLGNGDHTSLASINKNKESQANLLIKDNGIIAGIKLAELIFKSFDSKLKISKNFKDGEVVKNGDIAFILEGKAISILSCERLALNCMQKMSAIATKTNKLTKLISHTKCKLLDTRKTAPLNRTIEKWAVEIGGGINHRFGLYDMIMIKDNHIDFAGGISQAISKTKNYLLKNKLKLDIIVEARNLNEVKEILSNKGIKRILLDNFNYKMTKLAVDLIGDNCETESSGGITENTIIKYAECGVDYISVGALTNSLNNFDLSLKAIKN
jgi:nicotinate-nucleotide pyrophosphorylase (carboxylating)